MEETDRRNRAGKPW